MPSVWGMQAALIFSRKHPSLKPKTTMSASDKSTARDGVYRCDCGDPEASTKWICCGSDDCPVKWYHWECVQVTDEPTGDWLCPKCSHKSQEKRQLPDQPGEGKTSVLPNLDKTAAARSPSTAIRKKKGGNAVADKGHVRVKKGTAIKKPTPKKTRRIEWVEITSEDEDEDEDEEERIKPIKDAERTARMKARTTQSNKKRTQSQKRQGSSKRPSKTTKEVGIQPEETNESVSSPSIRSPS